jgi:hypothetical protein
MLSCAGKAGRPNVKLENRSKLREISSLEALFDLV